jgi:hypothetical protein
VEIIRRIEAVLGISVTGLFIIVALGIVPYCLLFNAWSLKRPFVEPRLLISLSAAWVIVLGLAALSFRHLINALGPASDPVLLSIASQWLRGSVVTRPLTLQRYSL